MPLHETAQDSAPLGLESCRLQAARRRRHCGYAHAWLFARGLSPGPVTRAPVGQHRAATSALQRDDGEAAARVHLLELRTARLGILKGDERVAGVDAVRRGAVDTFARAASAS